MTDDPSTNSAVWVCVYDDDPDRPTCYPTLRHADCRCGYVDAPPVPPPVPSRPDTAQIRAMADEITTTGSGFPGLDTLDALTLILAADWIDAQPAADQGPDLSEAAALLDEYDQSVHNLTRFGTVEAQTDHLLASERVAAFARRLLDREGGT